MVINFMSKGRHLKIQKESSFRKAIAGPMDPKLQNSILTNSYSAFHENEYKTEYEAKYESEYENKTEHETVT